MDAAYQYRRMQELRERPLLRTEMAIDAAGANVGRKLLRLARRSPVCRAYAREVWGEGRWPST